MDHLLDRGNSEYEIPTYNPDDPAVDLEGDPNPEPDTIFHSPPKNVPAGSVPVFDDEVGAVVGYRFESSGVTHLFDLDGKLVGMDEIGLEEPLFSPIDLVFVFGGLVKLIGKGLLATTTRSAARVATATAGAVAAGSLASVVRGAMRLSLQRITAEQLYFTATTAARMAQPGRYVPRHILALAIRHGRREIDPQGAANAAKYVTNMWRNGKKYELHVVLRESDRTVLHFHYAVPK